MPDEDELERRLWRTMPWDAKTMTPSPEQDAEDDETDNAGKVEEKNDHLAGL